MSSLYNNTRCSVLGVNRKMNFFQHKKMALTKNSRSLHVSHSQHVFYVHPRVWCHLRRDAVESFKTSQLHKFVKNSQKHFFSLKLAKNTKKTRGEIFCTFSSMKSLTLYLKLGNFVTSWNMTKTPQNFVEGSFCIKLTKEFPKNRIEDLASGPY